MMNARIQARIGWILTALFILFMLFDTFGHIARLPVVLQAFERIGVPGNLAFPIGVLQLLCIALYLLPRTSTVGALLLTGYLGGATAIQVRAGSPTFETIFPVLIGILLWLGYALRDARVRSMLL